MVVSEENCIAAVLEMLKGKKNKSIYGSLTMSKKNLKIGREKRDKKEKRGRGRVEYFRNHSAEIGKRISKELQDGTWEPKPYKEKSVYDELRGKWRSIRVPCLYDQAVHHAIMRVTAP